MRNSRLLTAVAVLLTTALAGIPALSTSADAKVGGDGDSVSRAADRYGVSDARLRAMLKADPTLRVAGAGLYYVDPAPAKKAKSPTVIAQAFPLEDTFELHSKPGSQRTIYLDFNGHLVSNTWWNQAPTNLPNGSHPAWTLDGDPNTFNDTERMLVQDVFQRVAEDYAPFDVDVTTEDPGDAAINRDGAGDLVFGTRALITPSSSAINTICGGGCGGVAFIDVFDDPTLNGIAQPAWVFPQALGPNNAKYIADATTHEVGHNLSLMHDGTTTLEYYAGHSNLWGPLMGGPYDVPITQWSLNEYPSGKLGGPNGDPQGLQPDPDDIATINGSGAPFRTDEPGNSIGTAGAVPAGGGVISSRTDVDFFSLGNCSGTVTVTASNAEVSPNLDIELQLLSAGGTVLDTDNPAVAPVDYTTASGMDATAQANVAAGTYYVRIDGIGPGNTFTAYNDYGSVGTYTLQVTGCGGPVVTAPSVPLNLTGDDAGGNTVDLDWDAPASNGGATITGYNIYLDGSPIGNVPGTIAQIINVPEGQYDFGVAAVNSAGEGPMAHVTVQVTDPPVQAVPGKPLIGPAKQGRRGGPRTATVSWLPPVDAANPPIDGYEFIAYKQNSRGRYVKVFSQFFPNPDLRSVKYTTPQRGLHKFAVRAHNTLGYGPTSAKSNAVRPR